MYQCTICIREQNEDGVYLIRYTNNGQQAVLVVHIPTNRLCKFKIIENDNFFIKIDQQFKTREDLLAHYKCHNLPGYSVKLTKSYRHV
ncbi:hypothetical protein LSAT2_024289 [Lamellibrachia satsuma]|nr:hypothetical protein LSAT2_024289 [Lamellibrachia satsuma]